jgi:hypothetical protein
VPKPRFRRQAAYSGCERMNWHRASVRGPPHTVMSGQDSGGPVDQGRATLRGSGAYIEAPGSRYLDDGVAIDHILAAANYRPAHREPFDFFGFVTLSLAIGALQMLLDRGELKDWFGSTEIWIAATVAGLGFYLFVVHTVTATDRSFLNRDLLKDGNFVAGTILMFFVGIILNGTLALVPMMLQDESCSACQILAWWEIPPSLPVPERNPLIAELSEARSRGRTPLVVLVEEESREIGGQPKVRRAHRRRGRRVRSPFLLCPAHLVFL